MFDKKECQKRYYEKNLERCKDRSKKWNEAHKEECRNRSQKWRDENLERARDLSKKNYEKYKNAWMEKLIEIGYDHCHRCGYDKCFAALDFHHKNPKEKEMSIGNILKRPISPRRLHEVSKTTPLCANCHRELHVRIRESNGN